LPIALTRCYSSSDSGLNDSDFTKVMSALDLIGRYAVELPLLCIYIFLFIIFWEKGIGRLASPKESIVTRVLFWGCVMILAVPLVHFISWAVLSGGDFTISSRDHRQIPHAVIEFFTETMPRCIGLLGELMVMTSVFLRWRLSKLSGE